MHFINTKKPSLDKLIKLFDASNIGLWEMFPDNTVHFFNANFYKSFNVSLENSTLDQWIANIHPEDQSQFEKGIETHVHSRIESFKSEYRVYNRSGEIVWIEAQGIANFDESGKLIFMVGSHTDITLQKNYNEKLYQMAYLDEQTRFFNRKKLEEDITIYIRAAHPFTIVLLDFDPIYHLVKIYGHSFSKEILELGSKVIKMLSKDQYQAYRISNSEFALLSKDIVERSAVMNLFTQLQKSILSYSEKIKFLSASKFNMSALNYPIENDPLTAEEVLTRAYMTLMDSQRKGSGIISFYSAQTKACILRNLHIETHMMQGLHHNEFYIVYQPILELQEKEIACFEALLRWHSSAFDLIMPDEFIPVSEANQEIIALGNFVLERSCAFIAAYNFKHKTEVKIAVNVSIIQLLDPSFSDRIKELVHQFALAPNQLILEITESIMFEKSDCIMHNLKDLKAQGIGIALDDFGTGYASLNNLIQIPLTELKIDREIMAQTLNNTSVISFLKSIVDLCHKNNITIVAEGIETIEMAEIAVLLNIDYLQGYYYSKPLSSEEGCKLSPKAFSKN
ncbi:putative bifunctional diguanylate cyclase/phosphodiesterase [Fusibacter ferrireducens]|uniref:EAL domain-containing protein n=1 Tax=Fusibacter ferrireducens TaxID=2785058 RepID=A0ABR9ZSQ1_9FIRM|nr:GGDEF domain-containing phosphodiesterase [Fusibacter ferrireducens]MBF4693482.1 EAL domain-containing protein [Fusibacter ferrireducens]